MSDCLFAQIV